MTDERYDRAKVLAGVRTLWDLVQEERLRADELEAQLREVSENEKRWKKRAEDYKAEVDFLADCRKNQERTIKELRLILDGGLPR